MKISITIDINETDAVFGNFIGVEKLSIDIAFNKYKFDVLKDNQEKRLDYIATEISLQARNVLVGNACYNLEEVLYLNEELKKYNLSLKNVYIPSRERIERRMLEALGNVKLHSRWMGSSVKEVEQSFVEFKNVLQEIIDGLKGTAIKVEEV